MIRYNFALLFVGCFLFSNCNGASTVKPNCGGSTSGKNIQLISPANPPRQCVYHIKAYSKKVCQLRIEFAMTLAQPSLTATDNDIPYFKCVNDIFQVGDVQLCGTETKQFINVPLDRAGGVSNIDVLISLAARVGGTHGLPTPNWNMKITQLECPTSRFFDSIAAETEKLQPTGRASNSDTFYVAPMGCLQYFPEPSGVITSFNYNLGKGIYPGMLKYAICFRRQAATKGLELKAVFFDLGGDQSASMETQLDKNCFSEQGGAVKTEDYLMIPDGYIKNTNVSATFFCGHSIDGKTVSSTNPGPLQIVFTSVADQHQREAGFYINYKLI